MDDNLRDKVAKLLKLADPENGATEAEAINAANRAQELCMKYGIEMASISLDDDSNTPIVEDDFINLNQSGRWRRSLATSIVKAMGGNTIWLPGGYNSHKGQLHVFAPKGTYSSIVSTFRALESWIDDNSALATAMRDETWIHGKTYRNSWILGAVNRITARVKEKYADLKQEVADEGNSMALVRLDADIDAARSDVYPNIVTTKHTNNINRTAYGHGQEAGSNADIGSTKIGNTHGVLNS
jgi:hypothetical protein